MASQAFQISALLLAFLGLLFLLVATVSSNWKICSTAMSFTWLYEGLWMHCTATSVGSVQCEKFHSFLYLDIILELTGFVFTLGGWVIVGATLSNSYWKISTTYGSVITTSAVYENLWQSCATGSLGIYDCREFGTLLALPAYIQACRALMITSLILGVTGTLLALLGLKCTQLGSRTETKKAKITMIGGTIFILSGLLSMVAISWYAARVTAEFFDSFYGGIKYELGSALYLGWAGSTLSILGGIFLTCSSCKGIPKGQEHDYTAAQNPSEPCIYIKQSESVIPAKDYV